jgi:hypothetical protein
VLTRCLPDYFRKGKWKKSSLSNSWVGIAIARGLGLNLTEEKDKLRVKKVLGAWLKAGSLEEYEETDESESAPSMTTRRAGRIRSPYVSWM